MTTRNSNNHLVSTSALAKKLELPVKALFELLLEKGWITRTENNWKLTGKGEFEGGSYVNSKKYGEFIGWPENIIDHPVFAQLFDRPIRTRLLGDELNISAYRFNALLAELGWQKRFHRGWQLTDQGKRLGGLELEDDETGVPYTLWSRSILENEQLSITLDKLDNKSSRDTNIDKNSEETSQQSTLDFEAPQKNEKPNTFTTIDGHNVVHTEDAQLCNWLYLMNICHAYQREVEQLGSCDFYLPGSHLHIECWHSNDSSEQLKMKLARTNYYKDNQIPFLELKADDFKELDKIMPKKLLKHGITIY